MLSLSVSLSARARALSFSGLLYTQGRRLGRGEGGEAAPSREGAASAGASTCGRGFVLWASAPLRPLSRSEERGAFQSSWGCFWGRLESKRDEEEEDEGSEGANRRCCPAIAPGRMPPPPPSLAAVAPPREPVTLPLRPCSHHTPSHCLPAALLPPLTTQTKRNVRQPLPHTTLSLLPSPAPPLLSLSPRTSQPETTRGSFGTRPRDPGESLADRPTCHSTTHTTHTKQPSRGSVCALAARRPPPLVSPSSPP
jgi:hypothetical protein